MRVGTLLSEVCLESAECKGSDPGREGQSAVSEEPAR